MQESKEERMKSEQREVLFDYCLGNLSTQECLVAMENLHAAFEPTKEQIEQILHSAPWTAAPTLRLVVNNAPSNLKGLN